MTSGALLIGQVVIHSRQNPDCVQRNDLFCPGWALDNLDRYVDPTVQHVGLVVSAVVLGFAIAFSLAILAHRVHWLQPPLLGVRCTQARCQVSIVLRAFGPPLDPSCCLDARHRGDEMRARQPEGRRKRIALCVVRRLLGDCGPAERAANRYSAERTRRATQLTLDDGTIIHRRPR